MFPVSSLPSRTVTNVSWLICLTWVLTLLANTPTWLAHNLLELEEDGQDLLLGDCLHFS